jgi:ArsR family transcriptional regulator
MASLRQTLDVMHLFGDETRVRLLALLERDELNVAELTSVMELSQSRVSTHLARLKEAGLLRDRRSGVSSFYAIKKLSEPAASLWQLVKNETKDATLLRDAQRLEELRRSRSDTTKWTDTVAGEMERHYSPGRTWETTARGFVGFLQLGATLDVGSGDGAIAQLVVERAHSLTCLDNSERMIEAARARLARYGNVRFCQGDMHALPFESECFDNVMIFNALTYSEQPGRVLVEAQRVLRPGGKMVVLCLRAHEHTDIAARYDHVNLGFTEAELSELHEAAGLTVISLGVCTRERRKPYFDILSAVSEKR